MKLKGRIALVIGAASGIGRACAEACADEGATVAVADLDPVRGQAVTDGIRDRGGAASFVATDITDEQSVREAVAATVREFGSLDTLITSVGATGRASWLSTVDLYLAGPYYACKYAIEEMERGGRGVIVNVSSLAGLRGSLMSDIEGSGYPSAKHGVIGLTKTIALAYATRNIRANAICPGYIRTEQTRSLHDTADGGSELINGRLRVPMGRWGEPSEIGKCAAFLVSDDASFITGQAISVDGGLTAR